MIHTSDSHIFDESNGILIHEYFGRLKATPQRIVAELGSFVVPKSENLAPACYNDGVIKSGADLRDVMTSQAVEDTGPRDLIRHSSVCKPKAAETHPPESI